MLTSLDFLNVNQPWPPRDKDTQERLKLYEQNRLLFKGRHDEVYKDWIKLLREDKKAALQIILNWPKRLSTLWADLLLGEPPRIVVDNEDFITELNKDNRLIKTAYEVALDVSRFGVGLFKARLKDGQAIIDGVYPGLWFPVVSRDNIREYQAHVLGWTFTEGDGKYLRVEIHRPGQIEHRVYRMEGDYIREQVRLQDFYPDLPEIEDTGVDDFLIRQVNNLRTTEELTGLDDYSDLDSIIQELETRVAQISRILDKHAAPNMYGPPGALELNPKTGQYEFRKTEEGDYFPVEEGEQPPGYVTWEGQLEAAFKEFELLMDQFYTLSETSAAAFGQLKQGLAESGSALRRLMMAPLAKVNRIRLYFEPELKGIIRTAAQLQGIELDNIEIHWRDGLPEDEQEKTQIETQRYAAGLSSLESSLRRLDGLEGDALQAEIQRIQSGQQAVNEPVVPRVQLPPREGEV